MSRAGNDFPLHVRCDQLGLPNEEFAAGLLTAEHKHRHRERRRAQLCEVLRVALEVFEILEAGAHAARLRISQTFFQSPMPGRNASMSTSRSVSCGNCAA